jgi:hypothetical protein
VIPGGTRNVAAPLDATAMAAMTPTAASATPAGASRQDRQLERFLPSMHLL